MTTPHYIVTRFATRETFARHVTEPAPLSPVWISRRFDLFERYCLPSMLAQTFTDWRWLIFVHREIAAGVVVRLKSYDPRITVSYPPLSPLPETAAGINVSSRLDSDDALAPDALSILQERAHRFVDSDDDVRSFVFRHGFKIDDRTEQAYPWDSSALFLTKMERATRRGVMDVPHNRYRATYDTEVLEHPEMYLVVSHGGNVANGSLPDVSPVPQATVAGRFPFLQQVPA